MPTLIRHIRTWRGRRLQSHPSHTEAVRIPVVIAAVTLLVAACSSDEEPAAEPTPTVTRAVGVDNADTSTTTTSISPPTTVAPTGITAIDLCVGAVHDGGPVVADERLTEISGIAFSRTDPGVLYAHNDSGDVARVFVIGTDGSTLDVISVDAVALDWEDMAAVDGRLFAGDIGDNLGLRPSVRIVEIDETSTVPTSHTFAYPAGRPDAEALIVDPTGRTVTIVTKNSSGERSHVYDAPLDGPDGVIELTAVGVIAVDGQVTAGDVTADGAVVALRTYDAVWLFDRAPGQTVADALMQAPCEGPSVSEPQGEAIALHLDGRGYTTISEGLNPTRNDFRLP